MIQWFLSKTVRQATAMRKHVQKLLHHQCDILSPQAIDALRAAVADIQKAIDDRVDKAALEKKMEALEKAANKWLKPYPQAVFRENVEVLLVALAVAMAIRTFFLQPFKIPTGSMQPTLWGVTSKNLINEPDFKIPTGLARIKEWFEGVSYIHIVAKNDGMLSVDPLVRLAIFSIKQTIHVGEDGYTVWLPPDFGQPPAGSLEGRAEMHPGQFYHKGDDVVKLQVRAGDHLFVDRLTYNFRPPERGEIIVFETRGIMRLTEDQRDTFYIKRLVGLSGETLSLQQDYEVSGVPWAPDRAVPIGHLAVNGQPLSAATPHFENLYSFYGADRGRKLLPYKENQYFGHGLLWDLAPGHPVKVGPDNLFVMGDNTFNSSDGRYWGDFPKDRVIGRSFFVYWPITDRFGFGYH
jgi:signal peptidase I